MAVFPDGPVGLRAEFLLGSAWVDVTADVYTAQPVTISGGRPDEAGRVGPGKCAFTLDNPLGRYSLRNPVGDYYGLLVRNTPLRVSVPGPLALSLGPAPSRITTPDVAALDIVGDLDVRLDAALEPWAAPGRAQPIDLAGKWNAGGFSWRLIVDSTGHLSLSWTPDNATLRHADSTVLLPAKTAGRLAVRAALDVDNGASGCTVTFWTAPTMAGPWTQLGAAVTQAGITSLYSGTAPVEVGDITYTGATFAAPAGRVFGFQLRSGIGGTAVAQVDTSTLTVGAGTFTDTAGRTWTLAGDAALTDRRTRFYGEVPEWSSRWTPGSTSAYTPIEAAGILRRLGQGAAPLDSTLRRRIPSGLPLAYWPMEDGRSASSVASGLPNGAALAATGFSYATDGTLPGSLALPQLGQAASLYGPVPKGTGGGWRVEMVYKLDTLPTGLETLFQVDTTGTARSAYVIVGAGNVRIGAVDGGGTVLNFADLAATNFVDGWGRLQITAEQVGSNVTLTAQWVVIGAPQSWYVYTTYPGVVGDVRAIRNAWGSSFSSLRLGHLAVFDAVSSTVFDNADTGFTGESADDRIGRVCAEEGIPLRYPRGTGGTAALGPQYPEAALTTLDTAADADMGILYETRDRLALAYRGRASLYNQTPTLTLDYAAGEVALTDPVEDDQSTRNDITVTRPGGSWARVTLDTGPLSTLAPPDGIGTYPESIPLNLADDAQVAGAAGWRLHLRTWEGARYPAVRVDLARSPHLIDAALAVGVGDRITITHPPRYGAADTIDLIVQGYVETIAPFQWDIVYTCTPAGPWTVGVFDDPVLGRLDTAGSRLDVDATAARTSLTVYTTTGPLWTTAPAEFPFDVMVGGERMTVTAISGTTASQIFTVTRSVNGVVKPQAAGTDVRLAQPLILAL